MLNPQPTELATTKLRRLLKDPGLLLVPGVYSPLPARLVEEAGFSAAYVTGAGSSANLLAAPDVGLMTMPEIVNVARSVAGAISIPVIADADTGYGNAINTYRTAREFAGAGVAAIQIEDQTWPKKCGHMGGKTLIEASEMTQKIMAARDGGGEMVVIARCDAIAVDGLPEALRRGHLYVDAGADVLFIEALNSVDEARTVASEFSGVPLLYNMAASGRTPFLSAGEVEALGFKLMILPNYTLFAAIKAMQDILATLRATGDVRDILDQTVPFSEFLRVVGIQRVQELEERYGSAARTTYEGR